MDEPVMSILMDRLNYGPAKFNGVIIGSCRDSFVGTAKDIAIPGSALKETCASLTVQGFIEMRIIAPQIMHESPRKYVTFYRRLIATN